MNRPIIFDIKRYAINDGPGIRTTLFFLGCPLRCVWCHNPESWEPRPHLTYRQNRCMGCQHCVAACPQRVLRLTESGIVRSTPANDGHPCCEQCATSTERPCVATCPTTALETCGRQWAMDELMAEVEKERDVMEDSGGGVTLCGGEPLMQGEAVMAVLGELGRRGLHRTVDTSLYAAPAMVGKVAKECELMLVDLKIMDSEKHRRYTGVPNDQILSNIRLLYSMGTPFYIRIPLIEGINADETNMEATATFLRSLKQQGGARAAGEAEEPLLGVNLLPYHDVGRDKQRRIWSAYNPGNLPMSTPTEAVQLRCVGQFERHGISATIGG